MFDSIKKALRRPEESKFVVIQAGGDYSQLPEGFFESLGGKQSQLGFYCSKCNYTLKFGAHNGVNHCGKYEMPPASEAGPLPQVRWDSSAVRAGANGVVANIGGNRVLDTDKTPGTWDGDVAYDGTHPSGKIKDYDLGNTAIDSGLWGGGR